MKTQTKLFFLFFLFFLVSLFFNYLHNSLITDLKSKNFAKDAQIQFLTNYDNETVRLYKQESNLRVKKQHILNSIPLENQKLYLSWSLYIASVRDLDDQILETRSERLRKEEENFPYLGLNMK